MNRFIRFIIAILIIAACSPANASTPSPSSAVNTNLLDAFSQSLSSQAKSSASNKSLVQAASGLADSLLKGNASISAFQTQIKDLKTRFDAAKTYLQTEDVQRISGYLLTLDSLALSAFAAYPVAQTTLFITELALGSAITSLAGGILDTISYALGLGQSIISLQLTLQSAYPNGQPPSGPGQTGYEKSLDQNRQMINSMMASGDQINSQLIPFFLGGGITPLSLATDVLNSSASSLDNIIFSLSAPLKTPLDIFQAQVNTGPFARGYSAATTSAAATSGSAIGSVAAAAANLAGLGGRRSQA